MIGLHFLLPASDTHRLRQYWIDRPGPGDPGEAYLTIRLGEVGPRGGTSKLEQDGYFLEEVPRDPEFAHVGREFVLVKDDKTDPCCYLIHVPVRARGACTCDGFRGHGRCKHLDALTHLCRAIGWRNFDATPTADPEPQAVGIDPQW